LLYGTVKSTIEHFLIKLKLWHILLAAAGIYLAAAGSGLSVIGDDSLYVLISRNFINGAFSPYFFSPSPPPYFVYYVLLPLLLVPFAAFAPQNFLLMKMVPFISSLLAIIAINEFLKGVTDNKKRKIVLILFACNPWIVEYSTRIMTELPFILLSVCTLIAYNKYTEQQKARYFAALVVFAGLSLYTRAFGFALIIAIVAIFAIRKKRREALLAAIFFLIILAPILRSAPALLRHFLKMMVIKQEYAAFDFKQISFLQLLWRMGYNFLAYVGNYVPDIFFKPILVDITPRLAARAINPLFLPKFTFGALLSAVALFGFIRTAGRKLQLAHAYVISHILLNLAINVYVARYILSLLPLMLWFFFEGLGALEKRKKQLVNFSFVFLFTGSLLGSIGNIYVSRTGYLTPEVKAFIECNEWIKEKVPAGKIILSYNSIYTIVSSYRQAVIYILSENIDDQIKYIRGNNIDYVLVSVPACAIDIKAVMLKTIWRYPDEFRLVYTSKIIPSSYVYAFKKTPNKK